MFYKISLLLVMLTGLSFAESKIDFTKDVMPILEESCLKCHGRVKENGKIVDKGDLDITKPESIRETLKAGHPDKSLFYELIISDDDDEYMPPKGDRLSAKNKKIIHDWIKQGSSFEGYTKKVKGENLLEKLNKGTAKANSAATKHFEVKGAIVMPLSQTSNLLQLNFKTVAAKTDSNSLKRLPELKEQIVWLNLSKSNIDDKAIETVGQLTKLTRLYLDNTSVSDSGLKHLSGLQNLEYLNLYNTQVTDKGLLSLASLKNLKKLYLWQSKVTPEGVKALKNLLPNTYIHSQTPAFSKDLDKKEDKSEGSPFDKGSCCDKARAKGNECKHPCCVKATKAKKICKKCNPEKGNN